MIARVLICALSILVLALPLWQHLTADDMQPGAPGESVPALTLALDARVEQFAKRAEKAPAPIAKVLQALAIPADEIELEEKKKLLVAPTEIYLGSPGEFSGTVKVKDIANDGKEHKLTKADVRAWTPYEETALARVQELRKGTDVPELERLASAQAILVGVWHFHLEQRVRPATGANPWQKLEDQLAKQLVEVRLNLLKKAAGVADEKDLKVKVLPFAAQLADVHADSAAVGIEVAQARLKYANLLFDADKFSAAEEWLAQAEQLRPDLSQVKALRQKLADKLPLPAGKPVLRIGVPALPELMSPALAWTDAEKEATQLLFESLVQARYSAKLGQYYQHVLAADLPVVLAGGRRFTLRTDAFWPGGERVTAADVRASVELLCAEHSTGQGFLWNEVVKPAKFSGDPWRADFHFQQAFFDPLLPFTFPVLPRMYQGKPLASAADLNFARAPVGSGPFVYLKPDKPGGPARFVVNIYHPHARQKSGFAEIQFHVSKDPVKELSDAQNPLHLILGPTGEQLARLKKLRLGTIKSLDNRRVHFLAVNQRKKALQDRDLRKGLAAAIQRSLILNQCFRGEDPAFKVLEAVGAGVGVAGDYLSEKIPGGHHLLNGPFPAGSWACKLEVPADLHAPDQALFLLRKARERAPALTLTLAYPNDDPGVAHACQIIAQQVHAVAAKAEFALKLELKPLAPRALRDSVFGHDYDLAYMHWDFGSEYYWLWPLFDPGESALAKGGSNFLGYDDAELVSLLRVRMGHQDFAALKKVSHSIHAHLDDRMPLIPLWQLDIPVVLHPQLETGELDFWPALDSVMQWRLK